MFPLHRGLLKTKLIQSVSFSLCNSKKLTPIRWPFWMPSKQQQIINQPKIKAKHMLNTWDRLATVHKKCITQQLRWARPWGYTQSIQAFVYGMFTNVMWSLGNMTLMKVIIWIWERSSCMSMCLYNPIAQAERAPRHIGWRAATPKKWQFHVVSWRFPFFNVWPILTLLILGCRKPLRCVLRFEGQERLVWLQIVGTNKLWNWYYKRKEQSMFWSCWCRIF